MRRRPRPLSPITRPAPVVEMVDFVTDGQPFEQPVAAADQGYAATAPSFGSAFKAMAAESSSLMPLVRGAERGQFAGSSTIDQVLYDMGNGQTDETGLPVGPALAPAGSVQTPLLSAEEANAKYAPIGPDGQRANITDAPMPEGVAQLVGKEKGAQIEREGVIARFQNVHSWPVNFGTGIAAFLTDPFNLVTAFVPGFGEEAVTARLGGGLLARVAGRAVSGAVAGAASQAPVAALRYGLGTEEASDYGLRDAMRDTFFAAAGNAVLGAGLGAVGDLLGRGHAPVAGETPTRPETSAHAVLGADAVTKYDAMRTAVAQTVDGRPIDVEPVFEAKAGTGSPADVANDQSALNRGGFAQGMPQPEFDAARDAIYGPEAPSIRPPTDTEPDLAGAEAALTPEQRAAMSPEEQAELAATEQQMNDAIDDAASYAEAGACLKGAA